MSNLSPAPIQIIQAVNEHIRKQRSDVEQYDNRELLDESGVYDLHTMARNVYSAGWTEGYMAALEMQRGNR